MTSVPDKIRSNIISHTVDVHRYEAGLRRKITAMIDRLGQDLVSQLAGAGLDTPRTAWQRARLSALLDEAGKTIGKAYDGVASEVSEEMKGLVQITGQGVVTACNDAFGAALMVPVKWTPELLAKLADETLIQGAPSAEWWARQGDGLTQAFADQMRQGMMRGETVAQLRDRIMGQNLPGVDAVGKIDLRTVQPQLRAPIFTARRNAEALVRTSVISTANAAHMAAYEANADIMDGVQWISTLDGRACLTCSSMDLEIWKWGETHPVPSLHWGCFVAGTKVQAPRILRGFERPYTGNVIIISTAGGHEVTCTPNHPILTSSGWVAAGDLHEGDEVITSRAGQWAEGTAPNGVEVETSIEDVVTSLLGSRGMVPVPVPLTSEDFHGDVTNQEVATVWTNGELWDGGDASRTEHFEELDLVDGTSGGHTGLPSERSQRLFSECPSPALHGFMGLLSEAQTLVFAGFGHPCEHPLTPIPGSDARLLEPEYYAAPRDPEMCSQGLNARAGVVESNHLESVDLDLPGGPEASRCEDDIHALPVDPHSFGDMRGQHTGLEGIKNRLAVDLPVSDIDPGGNQRLPDLESADAKIALQIIKGEALLVAPDEIVKIDRVWFSGHVYNLETEGNWYVANGIITHNCRCSILSVTKSWEALAKEAHGNSRLAKELDKMTPGNRASMGGPVSGNLRYEDWFNGQSEARQLEILGPGRLSLYKKGGLDFQAMIGQDGNPLTLKQLEARI